MGNMNLVFHQCPNGCVHLNFGNITVNLLKDDFLELAKRVETFARKLQENEAPQAQGKLLRLQPVLGARGET
ncbi:MAG: hypothetical protein HYW48_06870 [Deltaproteobacteria bacterium]|nr:hypothetical protein [Deltaproteobacteria bacterium]